ncbi:MAG TPA: hypothetical protein VJC02_01765 [Candidatus Paceibacterota bacterium]
MKKIFIYSLIAMALFGGANLSYADNISEYTLLEPLPCIEGTGNNCKEGETIPTMSLDGYVGYVFKLAIALAVFLAIVVLIYGGFEYMMSEAFNTKIAAKTRMQNAILGLLGALASYLILATIDPRLVQINTRIPAIKITIEKDVLDFQGTLEKDLKKLGVQYRASVALSEEKILAAEKRISEIENKDGERTPDEQVEIEKLKQIIRTERTEQAKKMSAGMMTAEFKNILGEIRAIEREGVYFVGKDFKISLSQNSETNFTLTKLELDKINKNYSKNEYMKNDPEAIPRLEFRRDFYKQEMDNERELALEVVEYQKTLLKNRAEEIEADLKKTSKFYKVVISSLTDDIEDRKSDILDYLRKIKSDPILVEEYKTLLNDRVVFIDKVLGMKK